MTAGTIVAMPRRGFSRVEAATYVGVGPTKFDEMVRDGRMPKPFRIDARVLWDLRALDLAFDQLCGEDTRGQDDPTEDWKDVA